MWCLCLELFVTLTLCAATFCNITSCDIYVMFLYYVATSKKVLNWPMLANMAQEIQMESGLRFQMVQTAAGTVAATACASMYRSFPSNWKWTNREVISTTHNMKRIRILLFTSSGSDFSLLMIVRTCPLVHFKCGSNFWELSNNFWVENTLMLCQFSVAVWIRVRDEKMYSRSGIRNGKIQIGSLLPETTCFTSEEGEENDLLFFASKKADPIRNIEKK